MLDALSETTAPDPFGVPRSVTGRAWVRREFSARDAEAIAQRFGVHPVLAEVMSGRGVGLDSAEAFLRPSLKANLPDPNVLKDMDAAVTRLADAVASGETIGVFGDYDVDGTTSCALFSRYMRELGVPHVVHLPDRLTEGYGPNLPAFRDLGAKGARLIVTLDCGAHADSVLGEARDEGFDVVVIDHHVPCVPLPPALAQVNPNRPDDSSGLGGLSAAGVVFMVLVGLNRELRRRGRFIAAPEPKLLQWLDLVALSLVCDVMPLTGLTRTLVAQGLRVMGPLDDAAGGNIGARALARIAGAKGPPVASHFGFQIGPRINAAGRIGHARTAYELLTTDDPAKAEALARQLQSLNGARQGVEREVLDEARRQAAKKPEHAPIVVAGEGWHPGVIGIVAGRLKERFHRPAVVIATEGGEGKGSARSVPGVDLGAAVSAAAEAGVIEGGGGHPMAAGLSLRAEQVEPFEAWLAAHVADDLRRATAERSLVLDGTLSVGSVTRTFCEALSPAGPYGQGNPEPRFALKDIRLKDVRVVGERHLAFTMSDRMGRTARAIAFGTLGEPLGTLIQGAQDGTPVHLAGRIKPDDWRGGDAAQLHVEDGAFA
ncbi:single-stranded-DNA-specific exonuclease RecJ [Parvularcula dongshanensis]|uniref:Single-stranded-DNA-specific exonuclease RecJ n=1 Tax=Parvularcula dongshanensis TaxID=1173995 RepID=A0A840I6F2_9PROT|nr:single-stranded-DNA-specific exonuclease RecJ [Parvularcula dongshanensis]MBB4660022.1 single-stranded-DNA-specific exonuclease [Parvularcula dongshanensis]